ncbi:MAG: bactofilin family protein, partial [Alphaproteobacteria bacterium]
MVQSLYCTGPAFSAVYKLGLPTIFKVMFRKRKGDHDARSARRRPQAGQGAELTKELTIISTDMTVSGDLHCKGEIRVNGRVFGDIIANELYVGEGALVEGSVVADLVTIHGSVGGAVKAPIVSIGKTARVVGTITHHT